MDLVGVWPAREVSGLDHLDDADEVPWWPVVDLREALTETYETDTHLCPLIVMETIEDTLQVPEGRVQPRINTGAVVDLVKNGAPPHVGVIFIDVDNDGHKAWPNAQAAEAAIEKILDAHGGPGGVLERAGVYVTRAGWRAVYVADPPIPAMKYAAVMGRPYAGKAGDPSGLLGWFAAAVGYGVDPTCSSPFRCYRAPRVRRDGVDQNPYIDLDGLDAGPLDVTPWLGAADERRAVPAPVLADVTRPPLEGLSPAAWAEAGLEGDLKRRYPGAGKLPSLAVAIRQRKAWFGPGERNEACFNAVSLILELLYKRRRYDPQDAADFTFRALWPGVMAACSDGTSRTPPDTAIDELWDIVQRRIGVELGRVKIQMEQEAAQEAARLAVGAAVAPHIEQSLEPDIHEIALPPLLCSGSGYYVLDARDPESPTYFPYATNGALVQKLLLMGCGDTMPEDGEGPLGLDLRLPDGRVRPLPQLILDYGAQLAEVVTVHGARTPTFDPSTSTLYLPGACAIPVEPEFDEQIDTWVRLLGGDDCDALLDWLATLDQLDRPSAAIYLQGHPGAGKGLFAACCSSVFGSGFNTFDAVIERFNGGLTSSPIIFLDEKANATSSNRASAAFRSLVAETKHRVEKKGQEIQTVKGATRLIIAANNAEALPLVGAHTPADVDAITSRIRWFGVQEPAAAYLRSIGGRDTTMAWVGADGQPGSFARYVRWLAEHRTVVPGPRFLVEGVVREYHEMLAITQDRLRVLNAITCALALGPQQAAIAGVCVEPAGWSPPEGDLAEGEIGSSDEGGIDGDDKGEEHQEWWIQVHATKLRQRWLQLTGERVPLSQQEITAALGAFHRARAARRSNLRVYLIPHNYIKMACIKLGHPEWEIEKTVRAMAQQARSRTTWRSLPKIPLNSPDWRKIPAPKGKKIVRRVDIPAVKNPKSKG